MSLHRRFIQPASLGAAAVKRTGAPACAPRSTRARALTWSAAISMGVGGCLGLQAPAASAQAADLQLVRRVVLAPPGQWTEVAVPLTPEGWRVGTVDGPAASAADLARWRAAAGLVVVAGRCSGAQSGSTHYACAFELALPPASGRPEDVVAALAPWRTTSDERMALYDRRVVQVSSVSHGGLGPEAAALLHGLLPEDRQLLGFYAPSSVLRGANAAAAPRLRLRGVDNPLQRARFGRDGLLVLSTRQLPAPAAVLTASERAI